MAHNFRYIPATSIAIYVSKAGSDSNSGLTPDLPKLTIQSGLNLAATYNNGTSFVTVIIGSGTYEETISVTLRSQNSVDNASFIINDGEVVLRGNGSNTCSIVGQGNYWGIRGIRFENYNTLSLGMFPQGCRFRNIGNASFLTLRTIVSSCQFSEINNVNAVSVNSSIFINVTNINISNTPYTFTNSYTNSSTQLNLSTANASTDYNNLMGFIKVGSGIAQSLADHKASNSATNQNSINATPKFNGALRYDFTLQADSPHIGAGSGGANIGGTAAAITYVAQLADCWKVNNGAVLNGLELLGTDFTIKSGFTSGNITSAPVKLFTNPTVINKIDYFGFMLFNKSAAGGTATNNNVPDSFTSAGNDSLGGGNPDRLSYQMRFTDNDIQPGSDVEWTNNYLSTAGTWLHFECNAKPLVDNAGYGNGNPAFNQAVAYEIAPIWVQWRVTLTNNYV